MLGSNAIDKRKLPKTTRRNPATNAFVAMDKVIAEPFPLEAVLLAISKVLSQRAKGFTQQIDSIVDPEGNAWTANPARGGGVNLYRRSNWTSLCEGSDKQITVTGWHINLDDMHDLTMMVTRIDLDAPRY